MNTDDYPRLKNRQHIFLQKAAENNMTGAYEPLSTLKGM